MMIVDALQIGIEKKEKIVSFIYVDVSRISQEIV